MIFKHEDQILLFCNLFHLVRNKNYQKSKHGEKLGFWYRFHRFHRFLRNFLSALQWITDVYFKLIYLMLSQRDNKAVIYWKLFITLFMSNGNKLISLLFMKSFKANQWPMIYSWKYSHISKISWMLAWIIKRIFVVCSHCSLFSYSKRHQSSTYRALEHNDYSTGSDRCFISSCRVFWSMLVTKKAGVVNTALDICTAFR